MNDKEKELAAHWLHEASDVFGNHGCNDVPNDVWKDWTLEERQTFVKEYHAWNGDPAEYDPKWLHLPDFAIMSFLAHKLSTQNPTKENKTK